MVVGLRRIRKIRRSIEDIQEIKGVLAVEVLNHYYNGRWLSSISV